MPSHASSYCNAYRVAHASAFNIANTSTDPGTVHVTDSCTNTCTFASSHSAYRCTDHNTNSWTDKRGVL